MSSNDYAFSRDIPYRLSRYNLGPFVPEPVTAPIGNRSNVALGETTEVACGMPHERWKPGGPEGQLASETSAEQTFRRCHQHPARHARN
jgi:hypothetical protein